MATTVANNAAPTTQVYTKPTPGETVITQTTVTTAPAYTTTTANKGVSIFSTIFGIIAGSLMWIGAVLVLVGAALAIRDITYYTVSIGILFIIGFSLWLLASLANWIPNFSGFGKNQANGYRSGYHIWNFFANILAFLAFALFIAGAGCFLSSYGSPRYAGQILWIIAGSFWLASMLLRDLGVRHDAMDTYRQYPVLPNNVAADADYKNGLRAHLSSIWSNALATDLYLVASVLFLVGAIMFDASGRSMPYSAFTADKFTVAFSVLWVVGASIVFIGSILHWIARR
jgi:hypothetical protein